MLADGNPARVEDVDKRLAHVVDTLEAGDRVRALDELLGMWRDHRAPAVADAVDAVSKDVARALPDLEPGRSLTERLTTWLEVCATQRAADVPRLLDQLAPQFDAAPDVARRLECLERHHPSDPRVARALVAMLCGGFRWADNDAWRAVFRMLASIRDARGHGAIATFAGQDRRLRHDRPELSSGQRARVPAFYPRFYARIDKLLAILATPAPVLSPRGASLVERIVALAAGFAADAPPIVDEAPARAKPAEPQEIDLLTMVWSAPDDPRPRQVYADYCSERGLARGEFIVLQHHPAPTARMKERMRALLKANLAEWLGPLEPVVVAKSAVFEGGFLTACETRFRTPKQREELATHPAWSTLREVTTDEPRLVASVRGLRRLLDITPSVLRRIAAGPPLPIEMLRLCVEDWPRPEVHDAIAYSNAFPSVVELETGAMPSGDAIAPIDFAWLLETPLGAGLRRLRVRKNPYEGNGVALGAWLDALSPTLEEVSFDTSTLRVALIRVADRFGLTLTIRQAAYGVPALMRAVDGLDPSRVSSVTLNVEVALDDDERTQVERAIERLRGAPSERSADGPVPT
jgi:uncharacterized protein (TIGR02996 family)